LSVRARPGADCGSVDRGEVECPACDADARDDRLSGERCARADTGVGARGEREFTAADIHLR
jgi:hypothetical protein